MWRKVTFSFFVDIHWHILLLYKVLANAHGKSNAYGWIVAKDAIVFSDLNQFKRDGLFAARVGSCVGEELSSVSEQESSSESEQEACSPGLTVPTESCAGWAKLVLSQTTKLEEELNIFQQGALLWLLLLGTVRVQQR
jgi:hypothetical protein